MAWTWLLRMMVFSFGQEGVLGTGRSCFGYISRIGPSDLLMITYSFACELHLDCSTTSYLTTP